MATGRTSAEFTAALRNREQLIGYWSLLDSPVAAERLARVGYDYLAFDAQHGLFGYQGMLNNLLATDTKGSTAVGMVRVEANDLTYIGRALDAGATAVIVPLIDNARDAADAVSAVRYPPLGRRSYGPMRAQLRIGPNPADTHEQTAVLAMIETADGLADVEAICATPASTASTSARPTCAWPSAARPPPTRPCGTSSSRPSPVSARRPRRRASR